MYRICIVFERLLLLFESLSLPAFVTLLPISRVFAGAFSFLVDFAAASNFSLAGIFQLVLASSFRLAPCLLVGQLHERLATLSLDSVGRESPTIRSPQLARPILLQPTDSNPRPSTRGPDACPLPHATGVYSWFARA